MTGKTLELRIGSHDALAVYIGRQLDFFGGADEDGALLRTAIAAALDRFEVLAARVNCFAADRFDHLHSLQYGSFLYLTARAAWLREPKSALVDRLFCLNKMVSTIELHPAVDLPGAFLLSHAIGAVLGAASYGEGLVVFQNVTVGRVGENRPTIGHDVVLYAGATVTGRATVGDGSVIAAGAQVHNLSVPPRSLVRPAGSSVVVEPLVRDYHSLYLSPVAMQE